MIGFFLSYLKVVSLEELIAQLSLLLALSTVI